MQRLNDAAQMVEHCAFSITGPIAVLILVIILLTFAWFGLLEISGVEYSIVKADRLISFVVSSMAYISYFIGAIVVSCAAVSVIARFLLRLENSRKIK
jgi:uncharacterized protein (DUF486 family)